MVRLISSKASLAFQLKRERLIRKQVEIVVGNFDVGVAEGCVDVAREDGGLQAKGVVSIGAGEVGLKGGGGKREIPDAVEEPEVARDELSAGDQVEDGEGVLRVGVFEEIGARERGIDLAGEFGNVDGLTLVEKSLAVKT